MALIADAEGGRPGGRLDGPDHIRLYKYRLSSGAMALITSGARAGAEGAHPGGPAPPAGGRSNGLKWTLLQLQ